MRLRRHTTSEIIWDAGDVKVRVTARCYSDPGRTSGPPENCYPPESDLEIVEVMRIDTETGTESAISWDDFDDKAQHEITGMLWANEGRDDDEGPDPPERDDGDDVPRRFNDDD